jgi:hypothetical protein
MRKNPRLFRLTATVALTALLWDTVVPLSAVAQPAPPPLPAPGQGRPDLGQNQGDPPARVGRIASMTGTVSFHNLGDTEWSAATPNYPVSSGNAFWTEPSSAARLEVSDSRIVMAGATEFDVSTLDASGLQAVAAQGEAYLHLRDLAPSEAWSIQTPRGLVRLSGEGRFAIVAGTTDQPTLVTVVDGAAQIDGPGVSLQVAANQTATITGTDTFQGVAGPAVRDAFLSASLAAERPPPALTSAAPVTTAPAEVLAMAGGSDLDSTGSWSEAPDYGQVWYPPVASSWVPYREGHWAYVAPWGWTWVDDAPWGFAPFHYGRWVQISGRWGWTPGAIAVAGPPVYAPALVTFIGIGAGVALGAAITSGSIGWVPLGPREPFRPWYHASDNYIRQVNVTHVTNITTINNVTIDKYVNRAAATSVPAAAMVGSRPIQAAARPVTPQEFAAARPITGQQPIRPTAATAGVTPVVARQLALAPAPAAVRPAPGPAVRPVAAGAHGFARPTFAPVERTQAPGAPPATVEPGRPGSEARPAVAQEPGRPGAIPPGVPRPGEPSGVRPEGARPAGAPTPEPGRPAATPPGVPRPGEPAAIRPEGARPAGAPTPEPGRPAATPPGVPRPGEPAAIRPAGARAAGAPTPEPGRPAATPPGVPRPGEPAAVRPEGARPPGAPAREPGRPAATLPGVPRSGEPAAARPEGVRPGEPRPEPGRPAAGPQSAPHPESQPAVVRPSPQPAERPAPAAVGPASRPEPQRAAQPPAPRPEPPRAAAPAPRPEARPAAPAHPGTAGP